MFFHRHQLLKALFCEMINYLTGSLEWFACAATLFHGVTRVVFYTLSNCSQPVQQEDKSPKNNYLLLLSLYLSVTQCPPAVCC